MKIALVYFSPTENTKKIATIVKKELIELNNEIEEYDITNHSNSVNSKDLEQFEAIIFGFPIYYWRAPRLIREWLSTIDGNNRNCSVFFTYGGVNVGLAHIDIKEILTKQDFRLLSTAEFIGKHTFNLSGWKIAQDRPNQEDFEIAKEYVQKTFTKFANEGSGIVNLQPLKITGDELDKREFASRKAIPLPFREEKECNMCRICEEVCPTNAMDADKGKADRKTCIRCLRCVANCPENVLKTKDMTHLFQLIKQKTKITEEIINNRKSRSFF